MQPEWIPPNVNFVLDDFNAPNYEIPTKITGEYDMIHGREILGSVSNWPELISKCFR
jgi:hypothetical protein